MRNGKRRYYDPELGRFISPDTFLDGLNRYAYCGNNPINYVDPTGNTTQEEGQRMAQEGQRNMTSDSDSHGNTFYSTSYTDENGHVHNSGFITSSTGAIISFGSFSDGTQWCEVIGPNGGYFFGTSGSPTSSDQKPPRTPGPEHVGPSDTQGGPGGPGFGTIEDASDSQNQWQREKTFREITDPLSILGISPTEGFYCSIQGLEYALENLLGFKMVGDGLKDYSYYRHDFITLQQRQTSIAAFWVGVVVTTAALPYFITSEALNSGRPATVPIGRRGNPLNVNPGTNEVAVINGRIFTGHAIDQMQGRGIMPSVVESVIQNGTKTMGNTPGTSVYSFGTVRVVVNSCGNIITVIPR